MTGIRPDGRHPEITGAQGTPGSLSLQTHRVNGCPIPHFYDDGRVPAARSNQATGSPVISAEERSTLQSLRDADIRLPFVVTPSSKSDIVKSRDGQHTLGQPLRLLVLKPDESIKIIRIYVHATARGPLYSTDEAIGDPGSHRYSSIEEIVRRHYAAGITLNPDGVEPSGGTAAAAARIARGSGAQSHGAAPAPVASAALPRASRTSVVGKPLPPVPPGAAALVESRPESRAPTMIRGCRVTNYHPEFGVGGFNKQIESELVRQSDRKEPFPFVLVDNGKRDGAYYCLWVNRVKDGKTSQVGVSIVISQHQDGRPWFEIPGATPSEPTKKFTSLHDAVTYLYTHKSEAHVSDATGKEKLLRTTDALGGANALAFLAHYFMHERHRHHHFGGVVGTQRTFYEARIASPSAERALPGAPDNASAIVKLRMGNTASGVDKLRIYLSAGGEILKVALNGQWQDPETLDDLLARDPTHGPHWRAAFAGLAEQIAANGTVIAVGGRGLNVTYFPDMLAYCPESVVARVVGVRQQLGAAVLRSNTMSVKQVDSQNQPTRGMDVGGVTRDFLDTLFRAFTDGTDGRAVKISEIEGCRAPRTRASATTMDKATAERLPEARWTLPELTDNERAALRDLGTLQMMCFAGGQITGRAFDDSFFACVAAMGHSPETVLPDASPDNVLRLAQHLAPPDSITQKLFESALHPKAVLPIEVLQHVYAQSMPTDWPMEPDGSGPNYQAVMMDATLCNAIKAELRQDLYDTYSPLVVAVREVAYAMKGRATQAAHTRFCDMCDRDGIAAASAAIQGQPMTHESVLQAILVTGDVQRNPITRTRVEWLKEWIGARSPDELEHFVKFVTGSSAIPTGKRLVIEQEEIRDEYRLPVAHTCFCQLNLSCYPSVPPQLRQSPQQAFERNKAAEKSKFVEDLELAIANGLEMSIA